MLKLIVAAVSLCLLSTVCKPAVGSTYHDQDQNAPLVSEQPPAPPTAIIHLSGPVNEDSADSIENNLKEAAKAGSDKVVLVINSPGGSVFSMFRIIQNLEESPVPVICMVNGLAASAAAIILESPGCKVRGATSSSVIMIHEAAAGSEGRAIQLINTVAALRAIDLAMEHLVSERSGIPMSDIEKLVKDGREWWLDSASAKEKNLLDVII